MLKNIRYSHNNSEIFGLYQPHSGKLMHVRWKSVSANYIVSMLALRKRNHKTRPILIN
jgi:hypothetical protein